MHILYRFQSRLAFLRWLIIGVFLFLKKIVISSEIVNLTHIIYVCIYITYFWRCELLEHHYIKGVSSNLSWF